MQGADETPDGENPSAANKSDAREKLNESMISGGGKGGKDKKEPGQGNSATQEITPPQEPSWPCRVWFWIRDPKHSGAIQAIFTAVIMLTGIIYTVFAGLQWCETKKSADAAANAADTAKRTLDFTRDTLAATNAAELDFRFQPISEDNVNNPVAFAEVYITNSGRSRATNIKGTINTTVMNLSSGDVVHDTIPFGPETVSAQGSDQSGKSWKYSVRGLTIETVRAIPQVVNTIKFEADFTYNDSFTDIQKHVCTEVFGSGFYPTVVPGPGPVVTCDCSEASQRLALALQRKHEKAQQKR